MTLSSAHLVEHLLDGGAALGVLLQQPHDEPHERGRDGGRAGRLHLCLDDLHDQRALVPSLERVVQRAALEADIGMMSLLLELHGHVFRKCGAEPYLVQQHAERPAVALVAVRHVRAQLRAQIVPAAKQISDSKPVMLVHKAATHGVPTMVFASAVEVSMSLATPRSPIFTK